MAPEKYQDEQCCYPCVNMSSTFLATMKRAGLSPKTRALGKNMTLVNNPGTGRQGAAGGKPSKVNQI